MGINRVREVDKNEMTDQQTVDDGLGVNGQRVERMTLRYGGLVEIDEEIAPIVKALNAAGVVTRASCSGHGQRPASIMLVDGREVIIARSHDEARLILAALSPSPDTQDDDETYEIGKREGYEQAVQDIDLMTGGDGEYRYCTDHDPERHTPDAATMKRRIAERFDVIASPDTREPRPVEYYQGYYAGLTAKADTREPTAAMIEAGYAIMAQPESEAGCDYKTLLGRAYLAMQAAQDQANDQANDQG